MQKFSIVTPTYNRVNVVIETIKSSLDLIEQGHFHEIILVDDGSTDSTIELISKKYNNYINENKLKIFRFEENQGVTAAKNLGASKASGDWIIFMDSDDTFTPSAGVDISNDIRRYPETSMFFFRCIDESGRMIGGKKEGRFIEINEFLNSGLPGECLPVLAKKSILENPYIADLRGCETTAYYQILAFGGTCFLSNHIARVYDNSGGDRLSTRLAITRRSRSLAKYYHLKLDYKSRLTKLNYIKINIKYYSYLILSIFFKK